MFANLKPKSITITCTWYTCCMISFSHALSDRHIFDAKWQNPFQSAKRITPILEGKNKPIYHPTVDSGDHVIVINRCGHYMDCYGGVSIKVYFLTAPQKQAYSLDGTTETLSVTFGRNASCRCNLLNKKKQLWSDLTLFDSRHVCLIGTEWQQRVYFHHPGYNKSFPGGGAKWIPAWQLHARDPTLVLWKACYNNMKGGLERREFIARLHIFPDGLEVSSTASKESF